MAIAPQQRLVAPNAVGSISKLSSLVSQVAPPSSDRQTPPRAVAKYTRDPPGAIAIRATRPLTPGLPPACPLRATEGPIGTQLLRPGTPGSPGLICAPKCRCCARRW